MFNDFIVTTSSLAESTERTFPESKHRSKRIRKKLIKRFGGEFKKVPAAYRAGNKIIIHPTLYAELQRQTARPDRSIYIPELKGIF